MNETKFDGLGKIYSQYRPTYPNQFISYIYLNADIRNQSIIADIGSGTGILTKQLLEQGNDVFAVEPNADMRNIAENNLENFKNFYSIEGTAENTTLKSQSIDVITVAQAFHWFDREKFKNECKRILKPNGKVILVWNSRDEKSEIVIENDRINRKYCHNFKGFSNGMKGAVGEGEFSDFFTNEYDEKAFKNDIKFNCDGFIGRNLSASYALKENEKFYSEYISELKNLFNKYCTDGMLTMPNFTRCYIGKV